MKNKIQILRLLLQLVFILTCFLGVYYEVHFFDVVLLAASFIFGNFFCGWLCPFGSTQELMGRLGRIFIKNKLKTPKFLQRYLQFTRYIIFALILLKIAPLFINETNGYVNFLFTISDITENTFELTVPAIIMLSYLLIATFFDRPFCNYLCTEGVKFGITSLTRLFSIKREAASCINCKLCDKACSMNISISTKDHVRDWQCINCLECVAACPKKDTLNYRYIGWKRNNTTSTTPNSPK